ncbi:MAG: DUF4270 family protein [Flavobacteriales bacterium]
MGIELQPDGQFDSLQFIDTFTVQAFTVTPQRQRSDEVQSYVGRVSSSVFGTTESALTTNFQFPTGYSGDSVLKGFTLDSVTLHLRPNQVFGVPSEPFEVEVFEIGQQIFIDSAYYSDFDPIVKQKVGQGTFVHSGQIRITDTMLVDGIYEAFQFIIPLDKSFGEYLFSLFSNTSVISTNTFQSEFNGLMVRPAAGTVSVGSIYSFALTTGESSIRLHVSNSAKNSSTTIKIPINGECARINQYTHQYSGSTVGNYLDNGQVRNDLVFVQGLVGSATEIQIPGLSTFGASGIYAASKATLSFPLADIQPSEFTHSKQLYLLDIDESGIESLTPDYVYSKARAGGKYNSSTNSFEFDVTRYVQRVLTAEMNGQNENYGLRLHAQVPVLNGNDTAMNVLKGMDNIVLKLYHTDLNN